MFNFPPDTDLQSEGLKMLQTLVPSPAKPEADGLNYCWFPVLVKATKKSPLL